MSSDNRSGSERRRLADFDYQIHVILRYAKSLNDWDLAIRELQAVREEVDELRDRVLHRDTSDSWSIGLLGIILESLFNEIDREYRLMVAANDVCSGSPEKFTRYFDLRSTTNDENEFFGDLMKGDTTDQRLVWSRSRLSLIAFLAAMEHVGLLRLPDPFWFLLEIDLRRPYVLQRYFYIPSEKTQPRTEPLGKPYRIEWLRSKYDIARWSLEIENNNGGPLSVLRGNYLPATLTEVFSVDETDYSNTNFNKARSSVDYRRKEREEDGANNRKTRIHINKMKQHPVVAFSRWTVENLDAMTKALEAFSQEDEVIYIDPSLSRLTRLYAIENVRTRFCNWIDETATKQIPAAYKKLRNFKTHV